MAGGIALSSQRLIQCEFAGAEMPVVRCVDTGAIVMSTGHHRGAGRRTHRCLRIETGQPETVRRHLVEVGRADVFATVEPNIPPPKIITHDEDKVGFGSSRDCEQAKGEAGNDEQALAVGPKLRCE